jgi:FtsP/CotA-like multicopper oxidase with cupredoxin domain
MSINRQIPGPSIHVCRNDLIVVDVENMMAGTSSTIHWHGFHHRESQWMDGVPFITQCPIDFATTFRYKFKAAEVGTQFFHSHSGHHKVNGLYGGIVVRRAESEDPNGSLYDHDLKEHLIVASDWMKDYGEEFVPGLPGNKNNLVPTNFLINGKGTVVDVSVTLAI